MQTTQRVGRNYLANDKLLGWGGMLSAGPRFIIPRQDDLAPAHAFWPVWCRCHKSTIKVQSCRLQAAMSDVEGYALLFK